MTRRHPALLLTSLSLLATACAGAGSTLGSGVGDRILEDPPYYAGARATPAGAPGAEVGIFPVYFQPEEAEASFFAPSWAAGSELAELLEDMQGFIDSLTTSAGTRPARLVEGRRVSAVAPTSMGTPPDVEFGCETYMDIPGEECAVDEDEALGRGGQHMKLAVARPSADWVVWASGAMEGSGVSHALVITLELGQYLLRQRGFLGHKYVALGTDHDADLPWLTSLETPLYVMQLTGALVDREGRAVRIGAEGILAKRTRIAVSALGAQEIWRNEDVGELRRARRDDLPGAPLAWQEALRALVTQLTQ